MSLTPKNFVDDDFLGALVVESILDTTAAARVRAASELAGTPVERAVLELGLAEEEPVYEALARHMGLPFIRPTDIKPGLIDVLGLDPAFLNRVSAAPVTRSEAGVAIATSDPANQAVFQSIAFFLSVQVTIAVAAPSTIRFAVDSAMPTANSDASASDTDVDRLKALANDGPVIKFVNDVVAKAVDARASDIHFEAQENGARIRYRVDGTLGTENAVTADRLAAVVSRIKVMADLNISEKRRPQDGRITIPVRGRNIDIRVSTLPTQFGESVVMRLLDQSRVELDWTQLGFRDDRIAELRSVLAQPNGIFLVAGPTGSGKTTTLYTALREINSEDRKIVTVEDPIEYSLPGINQAQVETAVDMTFARALRAILRQDPDVVMVGEIRDQETAEIAVRAALVGRLVLSTIHTNDCVSAITRLIDLGVQPFLLASTLRGVLSQRLVKAICRSCGGDGGDCCGGTGMLGRHVVSEYLAFSPEVAEAVSNGASQGDVLALAEQNGLVRLEEDAARAVAEGRLGQAETVRILAHG